MPERMTIEAKQVQGNNGISRKEFLEAGWNIAKVVVPTAVIVSFVEKPIVRNFTRGADKAEQEKILWPNELALPGPEEFSIRPTISRGDITVGFDGIEGEHRSFFMGKLGEEAVRKLHKPYVAVKGEWENFEIKANNFPSYGVNSTLSEDGHTQLFYLRRYADNQEDRRWAPGIVRTLSGDEFPFLPYPFGVVKDALEELGFKMRLRYEDFEHEGYGIGQSREVAAKIGPKQAGSPAYAPGGIEGYILKVEKEDLKEQIELQSKVGKCWYNVDPGPGTRLDTDPWGDLLTVHQEKREGKVNETIDLRLPKGFLTPLITKEETIPGADAGVRAEIEMKETDLRELYQRAEKNDWILSAQGIPDSDFVNIKGKAHALGKIFGEKNLELLTSSDPWTMTSKWLIVKKEN